MRPFCLNWNETEKIATACNSNYGLSKRPLRLHRPSHMDSRISSTTNCSGVQVDALNNASDQTDNPMSLVTKLKVEIEIGFPFCSRPKHLVVNLVLKMVVQMNYFFKLFSYLAKRHIFDSSAPTNQKFLIRLAWSLWATQSRLPNFKAILLKGD